jgi:type I restriction enzyme S subunit
LIEFKNGKSRPTQNGNIPVYGGNGILSYTDKSNAANAVIIGRVGTCGSLFLETGLCWVSDNAIYAKSKLCEKEYYDYFLLTALGLSNRNIGTSQPLLTQGILNSIEVPIPHNSVMEQFNDTVSALFFKIEENKKESACLATLRDTLLPKLMSGELSVADLQAAK